MLRPAFLVAAALWVSCPARGESGQVILKLAVTAPLACPGEAVLFTLMFRNETGSTLTVERAGISSPDGTTLWSSGDPFVPALGPGGEVSRTAALYPSATGFLEARPWVVCRGAVSGTAMETIAGEGASLRVEAPGELAVAVSAPRLVSLGQRFAAFLTVTNAGGTEVRDIRLSVSLSGGLQGGDEGASMKSLAPGGSRTVRFSLRAGDTGVQSVAGTAEGVACASRTACATGLATVSAVHPARLEGSLALSTTRLVAGQWLTVTLSLTNTGGATAVLVRPVLLGGALLRRILAPPAGESALESGEGISLSWTYSAAGSGPAHFSVSASCRDVPSGTAVSLGMMESPRASVLAPARLAVESARLLPEPYVPAGSVVMVSLTVANRGGATAEVAGIDPGLQESARGVLVSPSRSSPALPFTLEGGETRSVTWNCRAGNPGTALLRVTCSGVEELTGRQVKSAVAISNRVGVQ